MEWKMKDNKMKITRVDNEIEEKEKFYKAKEILFNINKKVEIK